MNRWCIVYAAYAHFQTRTHLVLSIENPYSRGLIQPHPPSHPGCKSSQFPHIFSVHPPPRPQPAGVPRLSPVSHCHSNNSPATAEHAPRCGDRHPVAAGQLPSYSAILKEKYLEPPQKTGTYQSSKVTILLYADQVLGFGGSSHWYPRKWKGIIVGLGDYQVPHLELVMWCFVKPHEVESKHGLWVDVTSNFGDGKLPVPGGDPISCSLLNSRYKVI